MPVAVNIRGTNGMGIMILRWLARALGSRR